MNGIVFFCLSYPFQVFSTWLKNWPKSWNQHLSIVQCSSLCVIRSLKINVYLIMNLVLFSVVTSCPLTMQPLLLITIRAVAIAKFYLKIETEMMWLYFNELIKITILSLKWFTVMKYREIMGQQKCFENMLKTNVKQFEGFCLEISNWKAGLHINIKWNDAAALFPISLTNIIC